MKRTEIVEALSSQDFGNELVVKGWVRTKRGNKFVNFIALNDGSTINNIQIVADPNNFNEELLNKINTGASISVLGELVESQGSGQAVEINAKEIEIIGESNPDEYPIQPKKHSLEFLREKAHLRFRTVTFSAVFKIRNTVAYAIHKYFNERGYHYMHSPLITGSDCEGAGEMFNVTTLDLNNVPKTEEGKVDYSKDFFGKQVNMTVSGQLEGELAATALGKIYTFGPTFRAENSNTSRHLAEFWMIEPEVAFNDNDDNMDLAEDFLKYVINYVLDKCPDELEVLRQRLIQENKGKKKEDQAQDLIEKLKFVVDNEFERVKYEDAIKILQNSKPQKKGKFKYPVTDFGMDLQSEHEKYLVEKHFKKPVMLHDYPKEIKSFYMKQNDDGRTVAAVDVLFPQIGEIIGGSERETDMEKLVARMNEVGIPIESNQWYLDIRRFGSVPHAGFGLGFERLVLFATGMTNIRDVIPFPRTPNNCEF